MAAKSGTKNEKAGVAAAKIPGAAAVRAARPPVVVIVGHVDHGKTTLLDQIRKTNVAGREAGGITQAVGAYEIEHGGRKITFIDTPGHEAFTAMRSRGAEIADIAVLVVAADEGVKPQTKEAIKIIEESKTPYVVAVNKVDKTGGSVDKAVNDLASAGVFLEGRGGQVSYHAISAKTGDGVNDLLDLILLAADLENLSYDTGADASGFVLEAKRDPRRGIEVTVIVKNGVLRRGDAIRTATAQGKVKILEDFTGKAAAALEPSAPAIVIGFEKLPRAGEEFAVGMKELAAAKDAAAEEPAGKLAKSKPNALSLILKAGDAGSLEALSVVLRGLKGKGKSDSEFTIIEESVGDITDGDVRHAIATRSAIVGFKDRVEKGARVLAEAQSVRIITSEIVYDLADAVEEYFISNAAGGAEGELEVLAVFNREKLQKQLIGGRVTSGTFRPKTSFEIMRGGDAPAMAGRGRTLEMREKKSEIFQADKGKEIGLLVDSQTEVRVGDKLSIKR